MVFRKAYDFLEDKYYDFLDLLESKSIPVYGLVDNIDKVIPSFALILVVLALIVFWLAFGFFLPQASTEFVFLEGNKPISGLIVEFSLPGSEKFTKISDSKGSIVFNYPISKASLKVLDETFKQTAFSFDSFKAKNTIVLEKKTSGPKILNFFVSERNGTIVKNAVVEFSCTAASAVIPEKTLSVNDGRFNAEAPENCGSFFGKITAEGFVQTTVPLAKSGTIFLDKIVLEKSKVLFYALTQDKNLLVKNIPLSFTIYNLQRQKIDFSQSTTGKASFNLNAGEYSVSVSDSSGKFMPASSSFSAEAGKDSEVRVFLSEKKGFLLSFTVIEKQSRAGVSGASWTVMEKDSGEEASGILAGSNAVSLNLKKSSDFLLLVEKDGFVPFSFSFSTDANSLTKIVELEKCEESLGNCGKLSVKVIDNSMLPVDNALVSVFKKEINSSILLKSSVSDFNGITLFSNIPEGDFFVIASKQDFNARSEIFKFYPKIGKSIVLKLEIASKIVKVFVKDSAGTPVPEAIVSFSMLSGNCSGECNLATGISGSVQKTLRVDRQFFLKVSKEGFADYYTAVNSSKNSPTINIVLKEAFFGNSPSAEFEGFFDSRGRQAAQLNSGSQYVAKFLVQTPADFEGIEKLGFHLRLGEQSRMDNEVLGISGINSLGEFSAGSSFTPDLGEATDFPSGDNNGFFKWTNAVFPQAVKNSSFEILVSFSVFSNALDNEKLAFNFRSWVLKETGYYRNPEDSALGLNESTAGKQSLYAETISRVFFEGRPANCSGEICFFNQKLKDSTGFELLEPLMLSKSKENFELSFSLWNGLNESLDAQDEIVLRFSNLSDSSSSSSDVNFSKVSVLSGSKALVDSAIPSSSNPSPGVFNLSLNSWGKGELIDSKIVFKTSDSTGDSRILVQVLSKGVAKFSRPVNFEIINDNSLRISAIPKTARPFTQSDINAAITDWKTGKIASALVKLYSESLAGTEALVGTAISDSNGIASFNPQSLDFGGFFKITAEKQGFDKGIAIIPADSRIATLAPSLSFSLTPPTITEQSIAAVLSSNLAISLQVKDAFFKWDESDVFLDKELMNSFIASQLLDKPPMDSFSALSFQANAFSSLSSEAEKSFSFDSAILFYLENTELGKRFAAEFPAVYNFNSPNSALEGTENCLTAVPVVMQGNTVLENPEFSFTVKNNCLSTPSQKAVLESLKASIKWPNEYFVAGIAQFTFKTPDSNSSMILSNSPLEFASLESRDFNVAVKFFPFDRKLGKSVNFSIEITGEFFKNGKQVKAVFAQKPSFNVLVNELDGCLKFSPSISEGLTIKGRDENGFFSIDSSACNGIVQVKLCENDPNCAGGTSIGGIALDSYLTSTSTSRQRIKVSRSDVPGFYGVGVKAKIAESDWVDLGYYPVTIQPKLLRNNPESAFLRLEKYNFNLKDNPADSTSIFNSQLKETVQVEASVCDWAKSDTPAAGKALDAYLKYWTAGLYQGGGGDICNTEEFTAPLDDYVSNLSGGVFNDSLQKPSDALGLSLSLNSGSVSAEWSFENARFYSGALRDSNVPIPVKDFAREAGTEAMEQAALKFSKRNDSFKEFDILQVSFKEHVHGDENHSGKANVFCNSEGFTNYNIGPTEAEGKCERAFDTARTEQFHVSFFERKPDDLQNLTHKLIEEMPGTDIVENQKGFGMTGENALPKVSLKWNWLDSGIDSCDVNKDGHYCDATQFSIMLFKRLNALDSFLSENGYFEGVCPSSTAASQSPSKDLSFEIPSGTTGFSRINYYRSGTSISLDYNLFNNSAISSSIDYNVIVFDSNLWNPVIIGNCSSTALVSEFSSLNESCPMVLEPGKSYLAFFNSQALEPDLQNSESIVFSFSIPSNAQLIVENSGACATPKTTAFDFTGPVIEKFIIEKAKSGGVFLNGSHYTTADVNNVLEYVDDLVFFEAWLVKDGFSPDFRQDFVDYYNRVDLLDAPQFFKGENGFWKFFSQGKIGFSMNDYNSFLLNDAGRFLVELDINFGSDWRLMSPEPKVIKVLFNHLRPPEQENPFYYLPFDGMLGFDNSFFSRDKYGSAFENSNGLIGIDSANILRTFPKVQSQNPLQLFKTTIDSEFSKLNSELNSRGKILSIDSRSKEIEFSSSIATPILLKVHSSIEDKQNPDNNGFAVFYSLLEDDAAKSPAASLGFWKAPSFGDCVDFSGKPLSSVFNNTGDRRAGIEDNISQFEGAYALSWESLEKTGDLFLEGIFYTNPQSQFLLFANNASAGKLIIFNNSTQGSNVLLNGVNGMQFNDKSGASRNSIDSLQELFEAVENKSVFITAKDKEVSFWWNEQKILSDFEKQKEAAIQACIK